MLMKRNNDASKVVREVKKNIYRKPILKSYGDVRDVTLGGSPGAGDSGMPTTRRRR